MIRPAAPRSLLLLLVAALVIGFGLAPGPVVADEDPPVPGPRDMPPDSPKPAPAAEAPEAELPAFQFDPKDFELLPLTDVERIQLTRSDPSLVYRLQMLAKRSEKITKQYAERKDKNDDGSKKLAAEVARVKGQVGKAMVKAIDAMREHGVDERVLALVAAAPKDGPFRIERYAHGLDLHIAGLTAAQRTLFERVVTEVNGAYYSLNAQRKRLELFAKQAEIEREQANQLKGTIDRQLRQMDKCFWQLVDYVLTEDQRVELKGLLPTKFTRVANAIEHLYALPDITAAQGTRIRAILTEMEAEAAPDQALVKRNQVKLRQKDGIDAAERKALQKESQAAQTRLQDLQLDSAKAMKAVLTDAQYNAFLAIPPNISSNERKQRAKRLLQGVPFTPEQDAAMKRLEGEYRQAARDIQQRVRDIRAKSADYGPDSPQMGMMEMEMAGAAAVGEVLRREAIGRIITEILTTDQVSGWVLGFYGQTR